MIAQTSAWRAGAAHTEIRLASMLCLCKALGFRIIQGEVLVSDWDGILPVIKTCLEDDWSSELRKIASRVCETLLENYGDWLEERYLLDIYPLLLARLEDSKNTNRIEISKSLRVFFIVLKANLSHFSNYKYMLRTLFTHLDDSDEQIQKAVSEVLRAALEFNKSEFLEVAREAVGRHRHPRCVKELIDLAE